MKRGQGNMVPVAGFWFFLTGTKRTQNEIKEKAKRKSHSHFPTFTKGSIRKD
jgi:hypothetical protein